ncbi:MAG: reverse transcriptase domain-containing protein, partial [Bacteroidota bacterium]
LVNEEFNCRLIQKELDKLKLSFKDKDEEISKWRNSNRQDNYACTNENIKKKLHDYMNLIEEHDKCIEKIKVLESRIINVNETPPIQSMHDNVQSLENDNQLIKNSSRSKNDFFRESSNDLIMINDKEFNSNSNKIKVNLKVPEFHGNEEENVTNWLYNIESIFSVSSINNDYEKLAYAKTYLRRIALTNFKAFEMSKNFKVTWLDFKNHMFNKYRPLHHEETIRTKLRDMKMDKSESIRSYVNKFQQCIFEIDNMAEKDKIFYFTSGLQDRTKAHVQIQSPKTLDEAIELAEKFETFVFNNGNNNKSIFVSNTKKVYMNKKPRYQFKPKYNKPYHKIYLNPKSRYVSFNKSKNQIANNNYSKQNERTTEMICYLCNEKGHIKSQCLLNKNKQYQTQNSRRAAYSLHVGNSNVKLLRYYARINDTKVGVVFDTAAECSLISKDCADKLNLKINDSRTKIDDSNGGTSNVIGTVGNQTIDLEGTKASIELTVTNIKNVDILLGLDWFAQTNVIIVPASRTIIIPSRKIFCIDDEEQDDNQQNDLNDDVFDVLLSQAVDDNDFDDALQLKNSKFIINHYANEKIKINSDCKYKSKQLLIKYKHLFSTDLKDLKCIPNTNFVIETTTEIPTRKQPFQLPVETNNKLKQICEDMEKAGIITKGEAGTWTSPAFLINQKGGERFIVDYRDVNSKTKKFHHPLPNITALLDKTQGSRVFTVLDAKKGYFQCNIDEKSRDKTGFVTPFGIYKFNRISFGLSNAPAYFTQVMSKILSGAENVANFIDDIIIFSKNEQEHLIHLENVFKKLSENNITLNPEKCNFFQNEVKILGYIIDGNELKADPEKIKAILDRKEPSNLSELQSWLGLANTVRRFIKNFSTITAPLHALTNKDTIYYWSDKCQIKQKLTTYPVLRLPNPNKPFILKTDASVIGRGAILCQNDDDGNEYVVWYISKINNKHEQNYSISELECLAIVWAVCYFRQYLYGRKFTIITDHLVLKWLLTIKNP